MLKFSDGLRHKYFPGLSEVRYVDLKFGISQYFSKSKNYIVTGTPAAGEFTIQTYDAQEFLGSYAFDVNRLSMASIESISNIYVRESSPKFLGWNLTKLYYSAFFSAHTILRLTERGLIFLDAGAIQNLKAKARSFALQPDYVTGGSYCLNFNAGTNQITFTKDDSYNESHEGLWKCFFDFLKLLPTGIYANLIQAEAQIIIDKIDELKDAITYTSDTKVKGSWLSKMRNLINYTQSYGVWFPYKEYQQENSTITEQQFLFLGDPLSINPGLNRGRDLLYFSDTCQLITSIAYNLLIDMADRNSLDKSFIKNGILNYKHHHLPNT